MEQVQADTWQRFVFFKEKIQFPQRFSFLFSYHYAFVLLYETDVTRLSFSIILTLGTMTV